MPMDPRTATGSERAWYRIENRAATATETDAALVYLFDEIGMWGISASEFVKELRDITAASIELHINSPGGEVFDGIAIFNGLRNHKAHITVIIDGFAASAASFIAMAGDVIKAERNATMMIHNAAGVMVGNSAAMQTMADLLERCSDNIAGIYAERAGGTPQEWRARMAAETWYTAAEALKAGLVDEVVAAPARRGGPPSNTWDLSIFTFAGRDCAPDPFLVPVAQGGPITPVMDVEPDPVALVVSIPAAVLVDEPPPEDSLAELLTAVFNPDMFRSAVAAVGERPFDPGQFRDIMASLALDAPAPPDVALVPVDLPPLPPPAAEPAQPPEMGFADIIRAGVTTAANDAPVPPEISPPADTDPADEPGFLMDAPAFTAALRRAHQ